MIDGPEPSPSGSEDFYTWTDVCALEDVIPGTAVAALVSGYQVALVRSRDGQQVYALSNFDPFSKTFVLARGIVGDRSGTPKITSPLYKQSFALETGQCLDDAGVVVPVFPVRVALGRVHVGTTGLRRST